MIVKSTLNSRDKKYKLTNNNKKSNKLIMKLLNNDVLNVKDGLFIFKITKNVLKNPSDKTLFFIVR